MWKWNASLNNQDPKVKQREQRSWDNTEEKSVLLSYLGRKT